MIEKAGGKDAAAVILGHQFLLNHMAYFYLKGDPVAGPYLDLPNLGVRHLRLEGQHKTVQEAKELQF